MVRETMDFIVHWLLLCRCYVLYVRISAIRQSAVDIEYVCMYLLNRFVVWYDVSAVYPPTRPFITLLSRLLF